MTIHHQDPLALMAALIGLILATQAVTSCEDSCHSMPLDAVGTLNVWPGIPAFAA